MKNQYTIISIVTNPLIKIIHEKEMKKKKKIFKNRRVGYFQSFLEHRTRQIIFHRGFPRRKRDRRGVSRNCSFQKRRSVIRGADNGSWAGGRTLRSQQRSKKVSLPVILIADRESPARSIFRTIYWSRKKMIREGVAERIPEDSRKNARREEV